MCLLRFGFLFEIFKNFHEPRRCRRTRFSENGPCTLDSWLILDTAATTGTSIEILDAEGSQPSVLEQR